MSKKYKMIFIYLMSFSFLTSCLSASKDKAFDIDWPSGNRSVARGMSADHDGIDIALVEGSPVYAAHKGDVIAAQKSTTYGNYIILEFSQQWATLYAHLKKVSVKRGDHVQKKQKIGLSGSSGTSSGPHLHFEVMKNKYPVNPLNYLPKK